MEVRFIFREDTPARAYKGYGDAQYNMWAAMEVSYILMDIDGRWKPGMMPVW